MQHSLSFFQNNFAGSLANKVRDLGNCTQQILERVLYSFFNTALSLIIAIIVLFSASKFFGFAMIFWALFVIIVAVKYGKTASSLGIPVSNQQTKITGVLVDILSNISNVKLFAKRHYERSRIEKLQDEYSSFSRKQNLFLLKFFSISAIAFCLYYTFCIIFLIRLYNAGEITLGDFLLVFSLSNWITHLVWQAAQEYRNFLIDVGTMQQALSIINQPLQLTDDALASDLIISRTNPGQIEFENVDFAYGEGGKIFSDKSIIINSGQKVGLVGHSGSGKSTFISLLLRLFDIDSGTIKIDDQDISKVTQHSLRRAISVISQDPSLFHRSLADNIAYGKNDATMEEIITAAKNAHADEFISDLQNGYDSLVGERGIKLSGGQRQRIAIARAFLKNAPILVLDEATSALDSITEDKIQKSLDKLMSTKTVLVIAHRLSTLSNMDRILVFENGQIVEDGNHQSLLNLGGVYADLWNSQVGGFIADGERTPAPIFSPHLSSVRNLV